MGFNGLETGSRDQVDYGVEQNDIRLIFSAPVRPGHPKASQIAEHGDFVQDIAFEVDDVDVAYRAAVGRGAQSAYEPYTLEGEGGTVRMAGIKLYGDVIHSLINRDK